jgi:probable HAF family extracellular repeat protein
MPSEGTPGIAVKRWETISPYVVLCVLWASIAGLLLAYSLASGHRKLRRLHQKACRVDPSRDHPGTSFGLPPGVNVLLSDDISSPCLVEYPSAAIVIPTRLYPRLSARELELVIAHEACHFARRDIVLDIVALVARCLFFFHPLVHVAFRYAALAREEVCDAAAIVRLKATATEYAQLLMRTAKWSGRSAGSFAIIGMTSSFEDLRRRIRELADVRGSSSAKDIFCVAAVGTALLLIALPWQLSARASMHADSDLPLGMHLYRAIDLGPVDQDNGDASIGDNGYVAATAYIANSDACDRAVLWNQTTPTSLQSDQRYPYGQVYSVNDIGDVVGVTYSNSQFPHPAVWTAGRRQILPGMPNLRWGEGLGISDTGLVVGDVQVPKADRARKNVVLAAVWVHGQPHVLGTLGGQDSIATAVNNAGQIVGRADTKQVWPALGTAPSTMSHAFLYNGDIMSDLGTLPGGHSSMAWTINNSGDVGGYSDSPLGTRAVTWNAGDQPKALPQPAAISESCAYGNNDHGITVGEGVGDDGSHALLWAGSSVYDLNRLIARGSAVPRLLRATSVNNWGAITAIAQERGMAHLIVLQPIASGKAKSLNTPAK